MDFPAWVQYDWRDMTETPDSVVARSEMERGKPKQRRIGSDVRIEVQLTLHFDSAAQIADFDAWFYEDIGAGQLPFWWTHPRTGATVEAMVVRGELGALTHGRPDLQAGHRTLKFEYWKSAW